MITGLEKNVLRHDLYSAVNRYAITNDDSEMTDLTPDQLRWYLVIVGAKPGDALTTQVDELVLQKMVSGEYKFHPQRHPDLFTGEYPMT